MFVDNVLVVMDVDKMKNILIIDDMKEVYDKIGKPLSKVCNIDYASTLHEGLGKIQNGVYDFIISDFNFGKNHGEGGLEIISAAKQKECPVLVMSRENVKDKVIDSGADTFTFKKVLFGKLYSCKLTCLNV